MRQREGSYSQASIPGELDIPRVLCCSEIQLHPQLLYVVHVLTIELGAARTAGAVSEETRHTFPPQHINPAPLLSIVHLSSTGR